MKKNIYSILVLCSIFILIINVFTKSELLTDIIVFSINLFVKNIFPSLFPMFIISYLLVEIGIPEYLGSKFNKIFQIIFGCKGIASFVFFMSMLTGFPSSAKYINDLIDEKIIDENDAQKILAFTFFSNPLFIVNTIGNTFLNSKEVGIQILIVNIISNIIVGIIFRNKRKRKKIDNLAMFSTTDLINKTNEVNVFMCVFKSIRSSLNIMINIFGIITFFLIFINILFREPSSFFEIFLTGTIEMTTGLKYLSIFNCSINTKIMLSTFFISFGGLSVHAQMMDILKEKKVKYLPFLYYRLLHGLVSMIIIFIFLFF